MYRVTQVILGPQDQKERMGLRGQEEQRAILETLGHLESRYALQFSTA